MSTRFALIASFLDKAPDRIHPRDWWPWLFSGKEDKDMLIGLAAHRLARDSGLALAPGQRRTIVIAYSGPDEPRHPDGSPMTATTHTFRIVPT